MFPERSTLRALPLSLPHRRGGVSRHACLPESQEKVFPTGVGVFLYKSHEKHEMLLSSPQAWGCFLVYGCYAEGDIRLPHRRGGVSARIDGLSGCCRSSPQAWGCFYLVDLNSTQAASLPHRRGGVSTFERYEVFAVPSSPQAWGCFHTANSPLTRPFVFPTGVGVFLVVT